MLRLLAFLLFASVPAFASFGPRVIYGDDGRMDYYQIHDPAWQDVARATALITYSNWVTIKDGKAQLSTRPYGSYMGLCQDEPFYGQEVAGICSGFLVAPDVFVTAGHCIESDYDCGRLSFVFGYSMDSAGQQPRSVPADHIYRCTKVMARHRDDHAADYAVVRLDRPVAGAQPLLTQAADTVGAGTPVVVAGYPAGLPFKLDEGGSVRESGADFFVASTDTYGGNSGSAVLDAQTKRVIGILVRGDADFDSNNGCKRSKRCTEDGCRGEDATHIKAVLPFLTGN